MFAAEDIEDLLARVRLPDGELIGEVARSEDCHLLCSRRGPAGIVVALAQELD